MKTVCLRLDYKCYPMWIYDNDILCDNDLVPELKSNMKVDGLLIELQNKYDSLFIDDGEQFSFAGFKSAFEKADFLHKVELVSNQIQNLIGKSYDFKNDVVL